jgi:asparagine synthase (glutamine-hydrolysing)
VTALAGVWNLDGKPSAGKACGRMLAAQAMYGARDGATWDAGAIALGRRLHPTLPEDRFDAQALVAADRTLVLVADVRLDNRDELQSALGIAPDHAREMADSAVLLAAWERWQDECFDRLVGDYAFAVWDGRARRLVLARDPLGARPLHYHRGKNFVAFASMPKGLHALPDIPREPDEDRIAEFLTLLPEAGSATFFRHVERVEAGGCVIVTPTGVSVRRHWQPQRRTIKLASSDEYAEALREHLDTAVRARLRGANGRVAAHLSAGFDSSAVATSAAMQLAASGGRVVAFTSVPRDGYDGPVPRNRLGDEGPIAAKTAALYPNMEHVRVRTAGWALQRALDRNFHLYDQPLLNICSGFWTDAIMDAARERKLSVLLTGQMGNMSISHDGLTLLPTLIRSGRWLRWLREGTSLLRHSDMRWRGLLVASFGPYMPLPLWQWLNRTFNGQNVGPESYTAIHPDRVRALDIAARARERALDLSYRPRKDGFESRLWVLRRMDLGNINKGTLAGWGVDQRDPTTDRRLIEFSLSVPEEQFLVAGRTKSLTRRAFASRLPTDVLDGRHKGYQSVDWHEELTKARALVQEEVYRLDDCSTAERAIDLQRLHKLLKDWPDGDWSRPEVISQYRLALLRAVSTGHFLRRATGSNA